MKNIILFCFCFIIVFAFYELFVVNITLKKKKKEIFKNNPIEVNLIASLCKLDMDKVNYKELLHLISIFFSLDVSFIFIIIYNIKVLYLQIIFGSVIGILLLCVTIYIFKIIYKKRGMIKDV